MTDATLQFRTILDWLCREIAARAGRDHSLVPLVVALHTRLRRILTRFDSLVARIRAGQRPPAPRDPARREPRRRPAAPPDKQAYRLPEGFGWVGRQFGWQVRPSGSQLHHLLTTDPELKAMLAADPRLARLLRPLCRMLGVDPASAGLPPPPPRRAPPPPAPPTSAAPAVEPPNQPTRAPEASATSIGPALPPAARFEKQV